MGSTDPAEGRHRKRIGKYVVTGCIGRGGMGMVYRDGPAVAPLAARRAGS